jgi:gamma-glutamyltranspeptidase/glutathione hydrolase
MQRFHQNLRFLLLPALIAPATAIAQQSPYTAKQTPYSYSVHRKVEVTHGAVVSAHPLASAVGVAILQKGGNAIDAAIATQLTLAVVYPAAGNIGGGGFMVAHLVRNPAAKANPAQKAASTSRKPGTPRPPAGPIGLDIALDYRERAPAAATRDMYLDPSGNPVQGLSENGHLASGVPGTIAGIFAELKYAKLPIAQLIQPAIDLAEKGFTLTESEARSLNGTRNAFKKIQHRPARLYERRRLESR